MNIKSWFRREVPAAQAVQPETTPAPVEPSSPSYFIDRLGNGKCRVRKESNGRTYVMLEDTDGYVRWVHTLDCDPSMFIHTLFGSSQAARNALDIGLRQDVVVESVRVDPSAATQPSS